MPWAGVSICHLFVFPRHLLDPEVIQGVDQLDEPVVLICGGRDSDRAALSDALERMFPDVKVVDHPEQVELVLAFPDAVEDARQLAPSATLVVISDTPIANLRTCLIQEVPTVARLALEMHRQRMLFERVFDGVPMALWELDMRDAFDALVGGDDDGLELDDALDRAAERVHVHKANDEAQRVGAMVDVTRIWVPVLEACLTGQTLVHREHSFKDLQIIVNARIPTSSEIRHVIVAGLDVSPQRKLQRAFLAAQRMEAVGQLAAGIAHDFNNILMVVGTYAEFLRETVGNDEDAVEDLDMITDGVQRATGLVSQLLAFTRRQTRAIETIELTKLVGQTERILRRALGAHIELETELAPDTGFVDADPSQLDQIIMNLVVNAKDAMPEGGTIKLSTRAERVERARAMASGYTIPPGSYAVLRVADTGVGMKPSVAERIFEPFFTTKAERGSGLGLSTVYGIVKQTEGFITVESVLGQGTVFEVFIPAAEGKSVPDAVRTPRPSLPPGDATVLLVEDNELVRRGTRRVLESKGYRVIDAEDGQIALEIVARESIDVLVTDIVMPGMNGVELHQAVRESLPDLPVVFTSGYNDHGALEAAIAARNAVFLQKPVSADALEDAISDVRRRSR